MPGCVLNDKSWRNNNMILMGLFRHVLMDGQYRKSLFTPDLILVGNRCCLVKILMAVLRIP